jgi:hypothetical protein
MKCCENGPRAVAFTFKCKLQEIKFYDILFTRQYNTSHSVLCPWADATNNLRL